MLGKHALIDYFNCDNEIINDAAYLEKVLPDLISSCGGTVLKSCFHQFEPQGVTGVVLIAESHCALHTWPEHSQVCVDIFSCGDKLTMEQFSQDLKLILKAERFITKNYSRGSLL